ncbi:MAG: glycoside hydrolase family 2 protein [Bacteroidota bacterium]|nr:glycoside hydrolase family 2 protein [Bacteroidota bacterium]
MRSIIISLVIFSFVLIPVYFIYHKESDEKTTIEVLDKDWTFHQVGKDEWLPAKIPGSVHTDLLDNKKIEDPFFRDNEGKQFWIEKSDWEYKTTFSVDNEIFNRQDIDLVFEGLDTYADVYLNDKLILSADNMFIPYEVSVKNILKKTNNELKVYFHSASNVGMHKLERSPYLVPAVNEYADSAHRSSVFTRKAPYHYGWDWGPRIVTCGVWRPIYLRGWTTARIEDTHFELQKLFSHKAEYVAEVMIESEKKEIVYVEVAIGEERKTLNKVRLKRGKNKVKVNFPITNPRLWWPNGFGEQHLYDVTVNLIHNDDVISRKTKKIGVRTIELVQKPDSVGKSFKFRVNGEDIFIKGSNYIPSDNLLSRVTKERYEKVIKAAVDANMNMLRVWGGAIYENDEFYDMCDEHGLLVWQDFMFACAMSPGDSAHLLNLKKEFEYNISRLREHPSLALWCGNNENMVAWYGWELQKKFNLTKADSADLMKTYMKIFYKLIPEAIHKFDSTRAYWPSSPSSGFNYNELPNLTSGDSHDWWIWFGQATFKDLVSRKQRFISEYGLQSYPEMKTIKSFASKDDMEYDSPLFDYKQRSMMPWRGKDSKGNPFNGNDMILEYIKMYYREPKNFEDFVYLSQLMQAEGLKYIIEGHRSHKPYCWGSMYWQIDDCWPTVSWSSIDYFYRWKAAHYFVRDAYKPIIVSAVLNKDEIKFTIISDKLKDEKKTLEYTLMDFNGKVIKSTQVPVDIPANSSKVYVTESLKSLSANIDPTQSLIYITLTKSGEQIDENFLYLSSLKDIKLSKPTIYKRVMQVNDGFEIEVATNVLAKNVYLTFEGEGEGFFSNNFFDLIPGKPVKIHFTTESKINDFENNLKIKTLFDTL